MLFIKSAFPSPQKREKGEAFLFFCISNDSLFAVRAYRHNLDLYAQLFFKERKISIEFFREFIFTLHFCHISLPSRKFHIDRLYLIGYVVREVSSTSLFIMINLVTPLTIIEYFSATRSTHPQRRLRPVTEPNSWPSVQI